MESNPRPAERLSLLVKALELAKKLLVMKTQKLKIFCRAIQEHEGWFPGSRSWRNHNPGNIRFVGQKSAVGEDDKGFAIFPDYQTGIEELENMIFRAATGLSRVYNPEMTFYRFFEVYAPVSDHNFPKTYAEAVAEKVGVPATTKIKDLVSS